MPTNTLRVSTKHTRGFGRVNMLANLMQAKLASGAADWYEEERNELRKIASYYGLDLEIVCAVVAHTSPQMPWNRNKIVASHIIAIWWQCGKDSWRIFEKAEKLPCIGNNLRKALQVLDANDPMAAKFGPKTGAFYANLCGSPDAVTVDRHHLYVATKRRGAGDASVSPVAIIEVQELTRMAARARGMTPADFQAAAWVARRNELNITQYYG